MKRLLLVLALVLVPSLALAGFTETLPKGAFLLEGVYYRSTLSKAYDNDGNVRPIINDFERYEPGGGKQGVIKPNVNVTFEIAVLQLQYGLFDCFSFGFGMPIVVGTEVIPNLGWEPGDYQTWLGHPYQEDEFWEWAASMGQPKPGPWDRGSAVMGDFIVAFRYRFSDHFMWFEEHGLALALFAGYAFPTGEPPDPEEVVAAGSTSWDLHAQGELFFHLSIEKFFEDSLDGRLTIGLDLFYEALFEHEYKTPTGAKHPLLLNYDDFVGETYTIDPGDFFGGAIQLSVVPIKGPALGTWLSGGDATVASGYPPLVTLSFLYRHVHLAQSDWTSDSAIWDWELEKTWRPGYKNMLEGRISFSLLRLGVPLNLYVNYRNQDLIGGKNSRPANVLSFGVQLLAKFW